MKTKQTVYFIILLAVVVSISGCALIKLPFDLLGSALKLAGQAASFADSLPKPPPWAFL